MRYSVVAHSDHFTVRQEATGDILTFEFGSYLDHTQARDDAHRVAYALNHAYETGVARGERSHETTLAHSTGDKPEVRIGGTDYDGWYYSINGVTSERYHNRASAVWAGRQEAQRLAIGG